MGYTPRKLMAALLSNAATIAAILGVLVSIINTGILVRAFIIFPKTPVPLPRTFLDTAAPYMPPDWHSTISPPAGGRETIFAVA